MSSRNNDVVDCIKSENGITVKVSVEVGSKIVEPIVEQILDVDLSVSIAPVVFKSREELARLTSSVICFMLTELPRRTITSDIVFDYMDFDDPRGEFSAVRYPIVGESTSEMTVSGFTPAEFDTLRVMAQRDNYFIDIPTLQKVGMTYRKDPHYIYSVQLRVAGNKETIRQYFNDHGFDMTAIDKHIAASIYASNIPYKLPPSYRANMTDPQPPPFLPQF